MPARQRAAAAGSSTRTAQAFAAPSLRTSLKTTSASFLVRFIKRPWTGTGQISRGAAQASLPITAQPHAAFPSGYQRKIAHIWAIEISGYVGTRSRSSEAHARLTRSASRRRARSLARAATANASERGGENGDRERKGGDRSQQQAARRAADVEEKRATGRAGDAEDKRKAGRAGDVEDKRSAEQSSGVARGAAARRRRGQDDAASIAATATISRFSSTKRTA